MKDPGYLTIDRLKREMADIMTRFLTKGLEAGSISDDEFLEWMSEVENIENMSDSQFYAWFDLIRKDGLSEPLACL